jgi:hypothetical protein
MALKLNTLLTRNPQHTWMHDVSIIYLPTQPDELMDEVAHGILQAFDRLGNQVQETADENLDVILTSLPFGEVLNWRRALMFTGRIQLKLEHSPTVWTIVHMTKKEFDENIAHFEKALKKKPIDLADFTYDGLAETAPRHLAEQGLRGGPILSLMRRIQAQAKCIRILLLVGDDTPERAYHFDLVGAFPYTDYSIGADLFYEDIAIRMTAAASTHEITQHEVVGDPIPRSLWNKSTIPAAMGKAGAELGKREFFTEMIKVAELVQVPSVGASISSQYSEGCFVTWDPTIDGLVATVTGSARPVRKDDITEKDLAVIVGVRADGQGAQIRHVEDKNNDPPSSEAVEMREMDMNLPTITLDKAWGIDHEVPVVRSKLHGHRGVRSYNPENVEYVPLDGPYFHYLVSCSTEAQARGITNAFARSETFTNPDDSRTAAFTLLPGHGLVIAEKWVAGKEPFQLMWEMMDNNDIEIYNHVPQGGLEYVEKDGRMVIELEPGS